MKLEVFSIYDAAVGAFNTPMFFRSRGEAVRSFQDAVNSEKSDFAKYASDYTMFILGTFDTNSGVFDTKPPERVTSALELVMKPVS